MAFSLISDAALVQAPLIIVKIGNYTFGKYEKVGAYAQYPNYIQSLRVEKINGQVNKYSLELEYGITEYNDPNYFDKVFASVSRTRDIEFSYGDTMNPAFMFKNEKAIIIKVSQRFSINEARISYTVEAVSKGVLSLSGVYDFPARYHVKPSTVIYNDLLAQNNNFGLLDLFPGMRNLTLCKAKNLIPTRDVEVDLEAKPNTSVFDYLQYLVDNMRNETAVNGIVKNNFYIIKFMDDLNEVFEGPYFQVVEVNGYVEHPEAYELDIGAPNSNCIMNFNVEQNENYSIFYDYQTQLHPQEFVTRISPEGEYEEVFAPSLSSNNKEGRTKESDRSWWTKMSQYPIKASVQIKGLLRPAVLMSYVRLNVLFYGRKHTTSGLYVVSKQVDEIGLNGYSTTLNLIRIDGDSNYIPKEEKGDLYKWW